VDRGAVSDFITRRIETYVDKVRLEAMVSYGDGKVQLDTNRLRAIVRDEPREVTELVVRDQIEKNQKGPAGRLQLALMLATAYQLEFGDDQLMDLVGNATHGESIPYGLLMPDGVLQEETRLGSPLQVRILSIENDDPQGETVQNLIRIFAEIERQPSNAQMLHGRAALSFPHYDDDPRPNFAIPGIRACIAALDARFPYYLYYIMPEVRTEQILSYANSLLPLELFDFMPGIWAYIGTEAELIDLLFPRMLAVRRFCGMTGDDPGEITRDILLSYPEPLASAMSRVLRSADGL
jgi:hypothetical protein